MAWASRGSDSPRVHILMELTEKTEISPLPFSERESYLQGFLKGAMDLVKKKRFEGAIKYLNNNTVAETLGLEIERDPRAFLLRHTPDAKKIDDLAASVAFNSQFAPKAGKSGTIRLANIAALGPEITGKPAPFIPPALWHEVVLIHLEEWLHGLQHIKGGPLTGESDLEKDVGDYLMNEGVPLARNFSLLHS